MAESTHVWGPWTAYDATRQYRRCIRCGAVQYRSYGTQPS
jgi:ribosomal protein S14